MTLDQFWDLIEQARQGADGCDEQADRLTAALAEHEPEEIAAFDRLLSERLAESYRWDLWAVAYLVNGGASDDGFAYFRGWLVAQGRAYFEAALGDPESAARRAEPAEAECEGVLYAASAAYEGRTDGVAMPPSDVPHPAEPAGRRWEEDEVERLYPRLAERFG